MQHPDRHPIYILPELRQPRRAGIRVLVLADGNQRGEASAGGYGAGARNVVGIAEHLAARPDVSLMVACILSPDNVDKRGQPFFAKVREQFASLALAIRTKGTLVRAGVRLGICGNLAGLRARGGEAALLAGAIEEVVLATRHVCAPSLDLLFGVGYGSDTSIDLDVDVIVRTGMEAEGALRLSGISSHPGICTVATTKLWPQITARDVDQAIESAKRRVDAVLARGHSPAFIVEVLNEMSRRTMGAPVSVTIPTSASRQQAIEAMNELSRSAPHTLEAIVGRVHLRLGEDPCRYGPISAPHEVHIIEASGQSGADEDRGFGSVLAPGQTATGFVLPQRPRLGHATVHACGVGAADIVDGICVATRFVAEHPPLLGADRVAGRAADVATEAAPNRAA